MPELTKGTTVIIPPGIGYHDYTDGILKFRRATNDIICTVVTTRSNDVYMVTTDGRRVYTQSRLVIEARNG